MKRQLVFSVTALSIILGLGIWLGMHVSSGYDGLTNDLTRWEVKDYSPLPDDGGKVIATALKEARSDNKRVLILFSARGCSWCYVLERLFKTDPALRAELGRDYVYVVIDVTGERNEEVDKIYGDPAKNGVPIIVILDANGKQLVTKGSGIVEGDSEHPAETYHISPKAMLNFLKEWASKRGKNGLPAKKRGV